MATFVNLTQHDIVFEFPDGERVTFAPARPKGQEARVQELPAGEPTNAFLEGDEGRLVPIFPPVMYGPVLGLPEPTEDTIFIVGLALIGRPEVVGRKDVVRPGTGPNDGAIRYPADHPRKGQVDAVTRFVAAG